MKTKVIIFISILILMASCATQKKSSTIQTNQSTVTATEQQKVDKTTTTIDTTKTTAQETTWTKIEFYEPTGTTTGTVYQNLNFAEIHGPVKSIITFSATNKKEDKGKTEVKADEVTTLKTETESITTTQATTEEKPAPDPKRWRYIFYILVLLTIGVMYVKRNELIKSGAQFIKKLFLK